MPPSAIADLPWLQARINGIWVLFLVVVFVLSTIDDAAAHGPKKNAPGQSLIGGYEKEAVGEVLAELGMAVEKAPHNKTIDEIYVRNLDVFAHGTGVLRRLNALHKNTLESTIRRELLVQKGEPWRADRIAESERILRSPRVSSFVVLVPVSSTKPGFVDLLVVTRDIWTLRPNSEFVYEGGQFTSLQLSIADNNLLGWRKHVSLGFDLHPGEYSLVTRWRDDNVLGKRWKITLQPSLVWGQESNSLEGSRSLTSIEYPLWSLASRWGALMEVSHQNTISRTYLGPTIATYDAPETPEVESITQEFRLTNIVLQSHVGRSFGRYYKHGLFLGHRLNSTRARLPKELTADDIVGRAFARDLFPRLERSSAVTGRYEFFVANYVTYRNIRGFDLPEVLPIGLNFEIDLSFAWRPLGSEVNFVRHQSRIGYRVDFGGNAYADLTLTAERRIEDIGTESIMSKDVGYGAQWFASTPVLFGAIRLLAIGSTSLNSKVQANRIFRVGGQADLRGYPVGSFSGTSFFKSSIELRGLPYKVGFLRVGYLAFWDTGHAADGAKNLRLRHNVGVGVKALIPQLGEGLSFLYWAVPIDRDYKMFPGRLSLGFEHAL